MDCWTHVKNVSGIDVYVVFTQEKILRISLYEPSGPKCTPPEKFFYILDYLKDHTKQPVIYEALSDFDLSWCTAFQKRVYKALALIPSGKTVSYGELAALSGSPRAYRAVGSTMSKNRFVIAIPCHRVLASGGKIGGFSSGAANKVKILRSEGINDF